MKAPVRWLERPDAVPDELLASMQAYRELGPSEPELAQIRAGVKARPAPAGLKWFAAISMLAGLGGLLWAMRQPVPVPAAPRPAHVEEAAPAQTEAPVIAVQPPEVAPPVRAKRMVHALKPRADAAAELALLRRARRLIASDPAAALALTEEHLHSYPSGVFAEERELLAIEALSQRDRSAAIARARAFARAYPGSVHQARIEAALGAH